MLLNQSSHYQSSNLPQKTQFSHSHSHQEPLRRGFTEKPFSNMQLSKQLLPSKSLFEDHVPNESDVNNQSMQLSEDVIALEQVINQIPSSQISLRKLNTSLSKSQTIQNFDSYQVSTQPSVIPSSQATPLNKIELVLDFEDINNKINNGNIRAPSVHSTMTQPFSNRSLYFKDKLISYKSEDRFSTPNYKSTKADIFTDISPIVQERKLRIDTHMLSSPDIAYSPYDKRKELSQSLYISDFSKNNLYKTHSQSNYVGSPDRTPQKLSSLAKSKSSTKTSSYNHSKSTLANFISSDIFNDAQNWIKGTFMTDQTKRTRCSCDGFGSTQKTCHRALEWIYKQYKPKDFEYLKRTYEKIASDKKLIDLTDTIQIQKDTFRTFPGCPLFQANSEGLQILERLLETFAKYDPNIGYVQGMNFLAGSLLYHAEEYLAFWILVTIFERLEMRDIFLQGLPGLSKHCQIIDMLIFNYLPKVYSKLCELGVKAEMYCSEWILTLFSSLAPIEDMGLIYDLLIENGWPFFYKLILSFLGSLSKEIETKSDMGELLILLKSQNYLLKKTSKSIFTMSGGWKDLCRKAQEFNLDLNFIYEMHLQFDADKLWFKTS